VIGLISLALVGTLALIVELFVPAGGIIGLVGIGSIITAVVRAFQTQGTLTGSLFLMVTFITVPTIMVLYFKFFPGSFMGKKLILFPGRNEPDGSSGSGSHPYEGLLGKTGTAETKLRPSGMIIVDGKRYSAVTGGEFIDENSLVQIIQTEGNRIVVRKGEE